MEKVDQMYVIFTSEIDNLSNHLLKTVAISSMETLKIVSFQTQVEKS